MRWSGRMLSCLTAAACALALGACTGQPTPGPTPTLTPTVVETPPETAAEREQRLAYEAAEKSYRTFRAELGRVLRAGGAKEATPLMKQTAGGPYLKEFVEVIQAYKGLGDTTRGQRDDPVRPARRLQDDHAHSQGL